MSPIIMDTGVPVTLHHIDPIDSTQQTEADKAGNPADSSLGGTRSCAEAPAVGLALAL